MEDEDFIVGAKKVNKNIKFFLINLVQISMTLNNVSRALNNISSMNLI